MPATNMHLWPHHRSLTVAGMQLLRDIPFTMIFWTLTEAIRGPLMQPSAPAACADRRSCVAEGTNSHPPHTTHTNHTSRLLYANTVASFFSGGVAAAATTPFDVIKTQQQTTAGHVSLVATARKLVQQHGYRGLWAGLMPRVSRAAPASAMVVTTYELLKQRMLASRSPQPTGQ
jgi:solute carrier family 25, member 39/40